MRRCWWVVLLAACVWGSEECPLALRGVRYALNLVITTLDLPPHRSVDPVLERVDAIKKDAFKDKSVAVHVVVDAYPDKSRNGTAAWLEAHGRDLRVYETRAAAGSTGSPTGPQKGATFSPFEGSVSSVSVTHTPFQKLISLGPR